MHPNNRKRITHNNETVLEAMVGMISSTCVSPHVPSLQRFF